MSRKFNKNDYYDREYFRASSEQRSYKFDAKEKNNKKAITIAEIAKNDKLYRAKHLSESSNQYWIANGLKTTVTMTIKPILPYVGHPYTKHWVQNTALGGVLYFAGGVGLLGLHPDLFGIIGIFVGSSVVQVAEIIKDRYKKKKNQLPPPIKTPTMDNKLLEAQRAIAALDYKKFDVKLPNVPSGWTVDDQRLNNDLYWQGSSAFWLNPNIYDGGKLDLQAPPCSSPSWWSAPSHEDVIPDQVNLVAASLEAPSSGDFYELLDKGLEELENYEHGLKKLW